MPLLLSILTFLSTLCGGVFAIRFRNKLSLIIAFSAGAVIGVVFFDLLPEAFLLGQKQYGIPVISSVIVAGFMLYMLLDRFSVLHAHKHPSSDIRHTEHAGLSSSAIIDRGRIGASNLSIHSYLDGISIGIAYQVSPAVGILIAVGVISHDFADGINTVSVIIKEGGKNNEAYKWLAADAIAPVIGVISTMFFRIPDSLFGLLLGIFSGFFLYLGASDLLPESRAQNPGFRVTIMTMLGIGFLYAVSLLVGRG